MCWSTQLLSAHLCQCHFPVKEGTASKTANTHSSQDINITPKCTVIRWKYGFKLKMSR